jgi:biopolymer transport protein ExbB
MSRWLRFGFLVVVFGLWTSAVWAEPQMDGEDAVLSERLAMLQKQSAEARARTEQSRAAFEASVQRKQARLAELEERARVLSAAARGAPSPELEATLKEATGASIAAPTAEDWARFEAGLSRVQSAAAIYAGQLKLYLNEVPGSDPELESIEKALLDVGDGAKAEAAFPAFATLLRLADEAHREAAETTIEEGEVWAADGEHKAVRLLRAGHAAFAYETLDGSERAVALNSPAEATGYRWSERLDPELDVLLGGAFGVASSGSADAIRIPLDVTGQLRADSLPRAASATEVFESGGYVMYPLALVALLALLLILERGFVLYRLNRNDASFVELVLGECQRGKFGEAEAICARGNGTVARTLRSLLGARSLGQGAMEDAVQERLLHELPALQQRMGGSAILAAVAPLLGLLGTVTGIIQTFRVIYSFGSANPGLLAGGISEALTTTAAGLCVAIPVFLIHSVLKGRLDKILSDAERQAATLLGSFSRWEAKS